MFAGRDTELEALREALASSAPALVLVTGPAGVGKTMLMAEAARGLPHAYFRAEPLADADGRALFRRWLAGTVGGDPPPGPAPSGTLTAEGGWLPLLKHALERTADPAGRLPPALLLDDFPCIPAARSQFMAELAEVWRRVRARRLPVRLVLAGSHVPLMAALADTRGPVEGGADLVVELGPLSYRQAAAFFPDYAPTERLVAWAAFGGSPGILRHVDGRRSLAQNVQEVVLDPDGPLHDRPLQVLRAELQAVPRYASVLRAVAEGRRHWSEILEAVPDFSSGGQLAPYLRRLEELRLVRATRSLDSAPTARNRRYLPTDPFLGFWFGTVLAQRWAVVSKGAAHVWQEAVGPALGDHAARWFPEACAQYVRLHGHERLGARARDAGALWGPGYEIPVAGTLATGAALYGACAWGPERVGADVLDGLRAAMRETRYGFGKEARHRVIFHGAGVSGELARRIAADELVHAVGVEELAGAGI